MSKIFERVTDFYHSNKINPVSEPYVKSVLVVAKVGSKMTVCEVLGHDGDEYTVRIGTENGGEMKKVKHADIIGYASPQHQSIADAAVTGYHKFELTNANDLANALAGVAQRVDESSASQVQAAIDSALQSGDIDETMTGFLYLSNKEGDRPTFKDVAYTLDPIPAGDYWVQVAFTNI